MTKYVLGLVTLFHPERYLGCPPNNLYNYPHGTRFRAERQGRVENAGIPFRKQYLEDHTVIGNGTEIGQYKDTIVKGRSLVNFLADPRLLRIPDENPGRPKWRMEFRRRWPNTDASLTQELLTRLHTSLSDSLLRVKGVWLNPSIDPNRPNQAWVNLVVGPCSREAAATFRRSTLKFQHDRLQEQTIIVV